MKQCQFLCFSFLSILLPLACYASDPRNTISVVVVHQPSITKITFRDKSQKLPTITAVLEPYAQAMITKEYPNGDKEELALPELPSHVLTSALNLLDDISFLRGIVNVTPRMTMLYKKCTDFFFQLLNVPFRKVTTQQPSFWQYFW